MLGGAGAFTSSASGIAGGFNGGGRSRSSWASGYGGGSGGGASDVRLNDVDIFSRVIVAGGGGGGGPYKNSVRFHGGALDSGGAAFGFGSDGMIGGGGGWYGGSVASYDAKGGSSFVFTATTANQYPSGCKLNGSHYLTNAQTIAGGQSFPAPGGGNETGHSGNGFARITLVE